MERKTMNTASFRKSTFTWVAVLALLPSSHGLGQQPAQPAAEPAMTAGQIADFFAQVGDQIYENCIFELSQEQIEVQQALIDAYVKQGATSLAARQLAVKQIEPPKLSDKCERLKSAAKSAPGAAAANPSIAKKPAVGSAWTASVSPPKAPLPEINVRDKKILPQWDCSPGVDYVTIQHKGYERKLTGGEICNPFEDVVFFVPDTLKNFRLGYAITTGRLFAVTDDPQAAGKTIAWAISGREACRNNPDPECLATRAVGPLPPGEYAFATDKARRVSWGPTSKRMVAGIYLTKLWHRERFTPTQTAAILARGNIAIHVRLKGEMSEACLGLGPKGWAYVASLIKDGRVTDVHVYADEPYPQLADKPPIVVASSFSLSSLFK